MYPNLYPHWPYLLYGRLNTSIPGSSLFTTSIETCTMSNDENYIFTINVCLVVLYIVVLVLLKWFYW